VHPSADKRTAGTRFKRAARRAVRSPQTNEYGWLSEFRATDRLSSLICGVARTLTHNCGDPGTTVQTDNGAVCGIVRWAPPQPAVPWSDTVNATAYASQCTQSGGGDEDCLYLNVWAPPGADGLAVMAARAPTVNSHRTFGGNHGSKMRAPVADPRGSTQWRRL